MDGGGDQWTPGLSAELLVNEKFRKRRAMVIKHILTRSSTILPWIVPIQLTHRWPWLNKTNQRYESVRGMMRRNLAEIKGS